VEATLKFQNTNQINQIAQSSHQGGTDFKGCSNNPGGNQETLQVTIQPTVTLSDQIPNFPTSSANYFANESIFPSWLPRGSCGMLLGRILGGFLVYLRVS
jgi:hypothetical protein